VIRMAGFEFEFEAAGEFLHEISKLGVLVFTSMGFFFFFNFFIFVTKLSLKH
jgi:hypothetical protein